MSKIFRRVYVEITNICNLNCSFCPTTSRKKEYMSVDNFKNIAKEISSYTPCIYLHIKGEPLMHPHLKEIISIAREYGLYVNIVTNGTLLKENLEILKNSDIRQISLSIHSFEDAEIKEGVEKYLDDIFTTSNEIAKTGTLIRYRLWNDIDNKGAKDDITTKILEHIEKEYGVDITDEEISLCTNRLNDTKLSDNIYLSFKNSFEWPDMSSSRCDSKGICKGLKSHLGILVDGTVVPCCLDNEGEIALGNILDTSLEEILKSTRAINILEGYKKREIVEELCKKCTYRKRFK